MSKPAGPEGAVARMTFHLLIDAVVRQTTVLLAQLATAGGVRAPLSNVANQVFLDLANELYAQGVSRKVSADMFGMALRTYMRRIQRLRESSTDRGRSLWEAVLAYVGQGQLVTRAQVLRRFNRDDGDLVRGVLHDLTESGLVLHIGSGTRRAYRAATPEELETLSRSDEGEGLDELIWAIIYCEGPLRRDDLSKFARGAELEPILERLLSAGRVKRNGEATDPLYSAAAFFVTLDAIAGWEAAVFDHFHAVVKTICSRLRQEPGSNGLAVGGSTYSFEVWEGHPLQDEILRLLGEVRTRTSELRARLTEYNQQHPKPARYSTVTFYAGQSVVDEDESLEG